MRFLINFMNNLIGGIVRLFINLSPPPPIFSKNCPI